MLSNSIKTKIGSAAIVALLVSLIATAAMAQPADSPATWLPTVDKPPAPKPAARKPVAQKPAAQAPATEKAHPAESSEARSSQPLPAAELARPAGPRPAATDVKPADVQPSEAKPAAAQPQPSAQSETPAQPQDQSLQADWVKAQIEELGTRRDLDEAARGQAIELYRGALSQLDAARRFNASASEFHEALQSSPKETAELRQQLEAVKREAATAEARTPTGQSGTSLGDVEQRLNAIRAEIASLAHEASQLDAAATAMSGRPESARVEQAAERQSLDKIGSGPVARAGETATVAEARRVAHTAERLARSAKLNMLQQDLISLSARQAATAAKRDLVAARQAVLERTAVALQARADELRKRDAESRQDQANRATQQLAAQYPMLERYVQQTTTLQGERSEMEAKIDADRGALANLKPESARIAESLAAADRLREIGVIGDQLGELLRRMRAGIPAEGKLRGDIAERERSVIDARLRRLRLEEDKRGAGTPADAAREILERLQKRADAPAAAADLSTRLQGLTKARADAVSALLETLNRRIDQLVELNIASKELLAGSTRLSGLLNDRLLWLPNSPSYGLEWLQQIGSTIEWLARPAAWVRVGEALQESARRHAVPTAAMAVLLAGLILLRGRMKRRLAAIADSVGNLSLDRLQLTPIAFLLSLLLALPWGLLPGFVGWLLLTAPSARYFVTSIGTGFAAVGIVLLVLRSITALALPGGVLETHFGWNERACRVLRKNTLRLTVLAAPSAFLLAAIGASPSQLYRDGLGRLVFFLGSAGLAAFLFRVLHGRRGVLVLLATGDGWASRTRVLWQVLLTTSALAIGVLGLSGYYDAASELLLRFTVSLVVILAGAVVYGMMVRLILITRQRLEVLRARERMTKAMTSSLQAAEQQATGDAVPANLAPEEVDLAVVSEQTKSLLRMVVVTGTAIGIWLVWRQMASALTLLDDVQLWTQVIATKDGSRVVPVTLSNVLVGAVITGVTLIAARNLPGLLEIAVLQRLHIDSGTRYAVSAIARYTIITVGLLVALQRIGADWSQMQWIVAALGVGVGFGLQEIVANFISGLILLFERPIRVGDVVTVGDLSGTISRIQIRATSITDWDNREIIVPNKALLTDKVINWTLSERVTRLVLKVGIAYGSDPEFAQRVMMETAKANPRVLESPPPTVFFLGFGASSLDFEVRVFVAETAHRMPVLHELHVAIERAFKANGIEIPFPQQDLHLKLGDVEQAFSAANIKLIKRSAQGPG